MVHGHSIKVLKYIAKEIKKMKMEYDDSAYRGLVEFARQCNETLKELNLQSIKLMQSDGVIKGHWYRVPLRLYYKCYRNVKND